MRGDIEVGLAVTLDSLDWVLALANENSSNKS